MRHILFNYKSFVDGLTAYFGSIAVGLYGFLASVDWVTAAGMFGGFILFVARASVDIPKAFDYWKERKERKKK